MAKLARSGYVSVLSSAAFLVGAATAAFAQTPKRLGLEFLVNSYTTGNQALAAAAMDADGDFVVAWASANQDSSGHGIFARRFSSSGAPVGSEFQVNTVTQSGQSTPAIAIDGSGDFVVAWVSTAQDGDGYGVFARRFNLSGVAQATEFQVPTYTTGTQSWPAAGMDNAGNFVITWHSLQDGSSYGVFARRFSSTGTPQAAEFQVNTYTNLPQLYSSVALDDDGDFVVAWHSLGQDGSSYGLFARRFSSTGTPQAAELQVSAYTADNQKAASVALGADGDFVIAWETLLQGPSTYGVFARRWSSSGVPQAAEFKVSSVDPNVEPLPMAAIDASGDFVVAWTGANGQDGDAFGVFARAFRADGTPTGGDFLVNTFTSGPQSQPAVASSDGGRFVVAWSSGGQDSGNPDTGIFAQRYQTLAVLDVDGNGAIGPLTDGLLVLRFMFGFTGTTLVSGAFDAAGCSRCNAPAIESYLAALM